MKCNISFGPTSLQNYLSHFFLQSLSKYFSDVLLKNFLQHTQGYEAMLVMLYSNEFLGNDLVLISSEDFLRNIFFLHSFPQIHYFSTKYLDNSKEMLCHQLIAKKEDFTVYYNSLLPVTMPLLYTCNKMLVMLLLYYFLTTVNKRWVICSIPLMSVGKSTKQKSNKIHRALRS